MGVVTWTAAEDDIIANGIAQDWTWGAIAAALPGRTSRTARLRADRLGIRPVRKIANHSPLACGGSQRLLERMEEQFRRFSYRHRIDVADARLLLMNATAL